MNGERTKTTGIEARDWPLLRGFARWDWNALGPDLTAGLTLAAIAIPEQMATARLAGFPPEAGFVAGIAGHILVSQAPALDRKSVV